MYQYGGSIVIGNQEITYKKATVNYAQQLIRITGSPTGGNFTLAFDNQRTPPLAYNASAATVQSALQALPTIGAGNVTVSMANGLYFVNFAASVAAKKKSLSAASSLTGGSSPRAAASAPATLTGIPATGFGRVQTRVEPWTNIQLMVKQRFKLAVSPRPDASTVGDTAENGADGTFRDSPFFPRSAAKYRQVVLDGYNNPVLKHVRVSKSPDRSAPINLGRASVTGNIYVFTVPPEGASVAKVEFYLDGALFHSEATPPYDLMGGSPESATAFDTATLTRSLHTLKTVISLWNNTTITEEATFSVR